MEFWGYALKLLTGLFTSTPKNPKKEIHPVKIETPVVTPPKKEEPKVEEIIPVVTPVVEEIVKSEPKVEEVKDDKVVITTSDLHSLGVTTERVVKFIKPLNETILKYNINTPLRLSHFLAQVLHESGNLKYMEEIASGSAYEGRQDLGNTHAGDGPKYKGRGLIQLTGRLAYKKYSDATGKDFINNPKDLAQIDNATDSAGWFWEVWKKNKFGQNMNYMADEDDFLKITYFVNGGYNGLKHRFSLLRIAYGIFGVPDAPDRLNKIVKSIEENLKKTTRTPREKALFVEVPNKETLEKLAK